MDYAANAGAVPVVACMGEKDVFFQAHVIMGEAMRREGLTLVNLISPGTGHTQDPKTHAEQMRRIAELVARGRPHSPSEVRLVTWSLKYSRCYWLEILGLERHYARAELRGRLRDNVVELDEPSNITHFAIRTDQLPKVPAEVRVGTQVIALPESTAKNSPGVVLAKGGQRWRLAGRVGEVLLTGKRPGLQGPIDDAFSAPFLCVRGTGQAWNAAAGAYADAALERFAAEWHHYFRGELPVKEDTAVTEADLRTRHLILFGDPGSNRWIAQALPHLPLTWTKEQLRLQGHEYDSRNHVPALIAKSPLKRLSALQQALAGRN